MALALAEAQVLGRTIECPQIGPQICAQRSASQVTYDHDRV